MPQRTAEQPVLLSRETIATRNRLSSIQHFIRMRFEVAQRLLLSLRQNIGYGDLMRNYFPFVDIYKQASIAQSHEPLSSAFATIDEWGRLLVL